MSLFLQFNYGHTLQTTRFRENKWPTPPSFAFPTPYKNGKVEFRNAGIAYKPDSQQIPVPTKEPSFDYVTGVYGSDSASPLFDLFAGKSWPSLLLLSCLRTSSRRRFRGSLRKLVTGDLLPFNPYLPLQGGLCSGKLPDFSKVIGVQY